LRYELGDHMDYNPATKIYSEDTNARRNIRRRKFRLLDSNLAKHPDGGVPLSEADKRALAAFFENFDRRAISCPGHNQPG